MIPYTRTYYLDTIEKGVKKLLNSTSIPTGQLEEMVYMIGELKKDPAYLEWTHEKALKNIEWRENILEEVQSLKEKLEEREQQYADLEQAIEQGDITYL